MNPTGIEILGGVEILWLCRNYLIERRPDGTLMLCDFALDRRPHHRGEIQDVTDIRPVTAEELSRISRVPEEVQEILYQEIEKSVG